MFVVTALFMILLLNFVIMYSTIVSGSMQPTVITGEKMLANRIIYTFSDPKRGDVVFFRPVDYPTKVFLKRVIGLPGDKIVVADGHVYVNDIMIEDAPIDEIQTNNGNGNWIVPQEHYFMLGDNRNQSDDSRFWEHPFVERKAILARAICAWGKKPLRFVK